MLKPSERTAWSSTYFISLARASLEACGHSPHLIQSCICWPSTAPHLIAHPGISHLTFIGSREVAHKVNEAASNNLVQLCLELGGKDPAIVLDDIADNVSELDRVAAILMRGVFQAAGQNCVGLERIIAQPRAYNRLLDKLEPLVRGLRVGDPLNGLVDVGACIGDQNFSKIECLIKLAVKEGARVLVGGKRFIHPDAPKGHYFQPTLIIDVTPNMRIAQTELFAPVMMFMRTPNGSVDDAIQMANSTPYGLGSSVFGRNQHDLDKVADGIKAGMVAVNDFAAYYAVQLPFGGVAGSGYGRFAGKEGLRSICNTKGITRDRIPWIKTVIPKELTIPFEDLTKFASERCTSFNEKAAERRAEQMVRGVVELGYGDGLRGKVAGLRRIVNF